MMKNVHAVQQVNKCNSDFVVPFSRPTRFLQIKKERLKLRRIIEIYVCECMRVCGMYFSWIELDKRTS